MKCFYNLEEYKDNIAVITQKGTNYTYEDMVQQINEMAKHFRTTGKKLFFILCNNNIEAIIGYLAVIREDHTALLLSHDIDRGFLNNLIAQYNPDYVWGNIEMNQPEVYTLGDFKLYETSSERKVEIYKELNLLLSTSGSTGSSKLVKLTRANLNANANSIAKYLEIDQEERAITVLPMNYSYGLSIINSHLLMGATLLLTNYGVLQKEFWKFVEDYKPTSLCGVPYTYEMYSKLRLTRMGLPSVKSFTQAGGKIFPNIAEEFAKYAQETGKKFFIMYGQTEATARISYLPYEDALNKASSIGVAIPDGQLYLTDKDGAVIDQPNVNGEMVYKGPNVMLGYATKESDLSVGDEQKGILYTGDLGYFDEDGYFYITGRKNRNIKVNGNRINLDEVEKILQSMNFKCYVGGVDDKLKIVLQEGEEDSVKKVIQSKIHIHPSQVEIKHLDTIPRNQYGKVSYSKMFS